MSPAAVYYILWVGTARVPRLRAYLCNSHEEAVRRCHVAHGAGYVASIEARQR